MAPVAIDIVAPSLDACALPVKPAKLSANSNTTLPARWMRDENVFQLEKRAIFSKVSKCSHT